MRNWVSPQTWASYDCTRRRARLRCRHRAAATPWSGSSPSLHPTGVARLRREIAQCVAAPIVGHLGEPSAHRGGRRRGKRGQSRPNRMHQLLAKSRSDRQPPIRRSGVSASRRAALEAALVNILLGPMPALRFMGERWGSATPFPLFCDLLFKIGCKRVILFEI